MEQENSALHHIFWKELSWKHLKSCENKCRLPKLLLGSGTHKKSNAEQASASRSPGKRNNAAQLTLDWAPAEVVPRTGRGIAELQTTGSIFEQAGDVPPPPDTDVTGKSVKRRVQRRWQ